MARKKRTKVIIPEKYKVKKPQGKMRDLSVKRVDTWNLISTGETSG